MRILKNILFLFLTGLTLHAFSADPFFPGRRGDLSNKRVRNFRTRITIAPLINFYKINKNHATTPSQKMSGLISVKEEVRLNQSHNMFLSLGAEYMIHGMNFNSYYFRPDTIRLYNGEMNYAYSLYIHELDFPLQLRISFNRENNAQYSPYMAMAYHLRVLLQGDLKVKQDGNVIEKKPEKITFRNPLLNEKCNPFVSLTLGIQKNNPDKNKMGFFAELSFRYGFSPYLLKDDFTASSLYITGHHLNLGLGIRL
ncbi:MAG: hypothetical protein JNK50_14020 [Bacteroidia bacterium]|nr:hypothetical protein [Bacteroidia bacterium]